MFELDALAVTALGTASGNLANSIFGVFVALIGVLVGVIAIRWGISFFKKAAKI